MKYFSSKNFTLYKDDSLVLLKKFPSDKFDLIFADPPYFLSNGTFSCQNGKMVDVKKGDWDMSNSLDETYQFHKTWLKECKRILKPNGTIWVSGTYHSIYQCGILMQELEYRILNDIAWFKPNASPNLSCRFFTASHETLIWARKEQKKPHIFNYNKMKEGKWEGDSLKKPNKQMRSVWEIKTTPQSEKIFGKHPTQKPKELLKRIILASTNKGDLILDPFTGSSTTGLVAVEYDRKFIGIDKEKEYLDLSIQRYKNI
ncbi:MAG: DNA methyltransferase [Candidatus Dojkabacteria bacterium]|nr:DNA methyltransferase [Candidatus Dojkabacteria bacterium]